MAKISPVLKKKLTSFIIIVALAVLVWDELGPQLGGASPAFEAEGVRASKSSDERLAAAFRNEEHNLQIAGEGTVVHILPDDNKGSRHQRFLLELATGQTLLVAHNIDLAPRVPDLAEGDRLAFYGEYEWSDKGGVIHWTHHDPGGRHIDGWLERQGERFE